MFACVRWCWVCFGDCSLQNDGFGVIILLLPSDGSSFFDAVQIFLTTKKSGSSSNIIWFTWQNQPNENDLTSKISTFLLGLSCNLLVSFSFSVFHFFKQVFIFWGFCGFWRKWFYHLSKILLKTALGNLKLTLNIGLWFFICLSSDLTFIESSWKLISTRLKHLFVLHGASFHPGQRIESYYGSYSSSRKRLRFQGFNFQFICFVFIGIVLSITAFPVLARILKEGGLSYIEPVALSMGAAAIDNGTAWCLLISVILWTLRASSFSVWFRMASGCTSSSSRCWSRLRSSSRRSTFLWWMAICSLYRVLGFPLCWTTGEFTVCDCRPPVSSNVWNCSLYVLQLQLFFWFLYDIYYELATCVPINCNCALVGFN